ncbi:MAG: molybdate ABC transporter permease subunit, partial [Pseudomonadota bacterium]
MVFAVPFAWWLARTHSVFKPILEAITAMPLVLPPTVLGFYLLLLFSPANPLGSAWLTLTGETLSFSFTGLVIASMLYSLPFAVQPLQSAFEQLDEAALEAASSLGAGPIDRLFSLALPMARRGVITAAILTFAHTVGEFGVVLMVGGNIPGETRVISIAIYEHVETLRYAEAHQLSALMLVFSF